VFSKRLSLLPILILSVIILTPSTLAGEEKEERIFDTAVLLENYHAFKAGGEAFEFDSNNDGSIDYYLKMNGKGKKSVEVLDFDHDGVMDDFYYYTKGILTRRELDSNSDGMIDIWVYLDEGVYVKKYERDTDFDGVVETVKDYEKEAEQRAQASDRR
jgi:hypothetical protein